MLRGRDYYHRFDSLADDQNVAVVTQNLETVGPARDSLSSRLLQWLPFAVVRPFAAVGDFLVIILVSVLTGVCYHWFFLGIEGKIGNFLALGALVSVNFCAFSGAQQNYSPVNLANFTRQIRYATFNWFIIFAVLTMVAFTLKITADFSRGATLSFFFAGWASLIAIRAFSAEWLTQAWRTGAFSKQRYILVAERGQSLKSPVLTDLYRCGYRPAQIIEVVPPELNSTSADSSLARKVADLCAANQADPVSCIFVMMQWVRSRKIANLVQLLRTLPVPVYLLPDEHIGNFIKNGLETVGTVAAVTLQRAPLNTFEQTAKRVFDVSIAAILIVLLSPLLLMVSLVIKLDSVGPVIFKQKRHGFNKSIFLIYKFRTMSVLEDGDNVVQVRRNDPRITPIGRWLRQMSIDELPQLFNVLKGDMSLIGPRPHAISHDDHYQELVADYACRQHVKPGITGWAQVNGFRGETTVIGSMAKRIDHDLWYIYHWSFWLDLKILSKTILVAFRQPTAY
jgi:Undecaprenyl-phosphate glucose phosphotransferase